MSSSNDSDLKQHAIAIWKAGVAAVDSQKLVQGFVSVTPTHLRFGETEIAHADYGRIIILGAGKASGWMAAGLAQVLENDFIKNKMRFGRVNVPDDQIMHTDAIEMVGCRPPGINLPTERVLASTRKLIEIAAGCQPEDLLIYLISGGGSALLEKPVSPITLNDFCDVTRLLSHRGASIEELNCVRKRISEVKSGGFARLAGCRQMITLIVSDVIGDPLDVIASGPTVDEPSNTDASQHNQLAMDVLKRFDPQLSDVPTTVLDVLNNQHQEISHPTINTEVRHFIIGNNELAVAAARSKAVELGYVCETETVAASEPTELAGQSLIQRLLNTTPFKTTGGQRCIISGGEPTVKLCEEPGRGGRNQQLVLAAMQETLSLKRSGSVEYCFLSGGTDGEDGNVPVAGALFDSQTIEQVRNGGDERKLIQHLMANDSFPLLEEWGCLLKTPPTRTNVCDLRIGIRT